VPAAKERPPLHARPAPDNTTTKTAADDHILLRINVLPRLTVI
jgi:hypothetical protein